TRMSENIPLTSNFGTFLLYMMTCIVAIVAQDSSALGRVRSPSGPELQGRSSQNTVASEMQPYLPCALDQRQAVELRIVANRLLSPDPRKAVLREQPGKQLRL